MTGWWVTSLSPTVSTTQSQGSSSVRPSRTYCAEWRLSRIRVRSLHSVSADEEAALPAPSLQREFPFPAPGGDRFND
jgi:hypothetical protein